MSNLLDCLGEPPCAACRERARVPVAMDGQLCAECLAGVPVVLTRLRAQPECIAAAWALGPYAGPIGALVRAGKYGGDEALLRTLGRQCAVGLPAIAVDFVVPVPSSPWRRVLRGCNPAELLAHPVAGRVGAPLVRPLRRRRSASQAGLQRRTRALNARGSWVAVAPVAGRVLLVDDVLTTGATAAACAAELLGAGADEVLLLVVAAAAGADIPVS